MTKQLNLGEWILRIQPDPTSQGGKIISSDRDHTRYPPAGFRSLEIKANYTCDARCDFCCASGRNTKRTMTFEEVAANVLFFKERYGIEEVCLSGGEPTVHRSFLSHLRFIRSQGLKTYLHTNAQRLAREEFIEEASPLVDRTLVGFSFHDSTSCEFLTGSALSFDLRKAGIRKLLDHSVPLRTNTVIMRANYQFLPEISRVIESMGVRSALFTFPFFFERTEDQVKKFSPPAFREVKPALRAAFDFLKGCGVEVFLQGLPPCRLDEFEHFREVDPDRAFVDSSCQFEEHSFLFSGMLGYARDSSCNDCAYEGECWGHPLPGAMGALDEDCQEQGQ